MKKLLFIIALVSFLSLKMFAQLVNPGDTTGTLITAAIRPNSQADDIATAYTNEIRGGLHNYKTWAELENEKPARLVVGMLASVQDSTGKLYEYVNSQDQLISVRFGNFAVADAAEIADGGDGFTDYIGGNLSALGYNQTEIEALFASDDFTIGPLSIVEMGDELTDYEDYFDYYGGIYVITYIDQDTNFWTEKLILPGWVRDGAYSAANGTFQGVGKGSYGIFPESSNTEIFAGIDDDNRKAILFAQRPQFGGTFSTGYSYVQHDKVELYTKNQAGTWARFSLNTSPLSLWQYYQDASNYSKITLTNNQLTLTATSHIYVSAGHWSSPGIEYFDINPTYFTDKSLIPKGWADERYMFNHIAFQSSLSAALNLKIDFLVDRYHRLRIDDFGAVLTFEAPTTMDSNESKEVRVYIQADVLTLVNWPSAFDDSWLTVPPTEFALGEKGIFTITNYGLNIFICKYEKVIQ